MLAINSVFHDSAMAGCLGGRQRLAGAKPLAGHLSISQRLAGWGAVREPRANAAADLLSQGPAAAAAAGGGASSVARPLSSSSSCVVVRRVSSVVCRRLSLSVVVGCAVVVFCRLSQVVSSSLMTMMVRH